MEGSWLATQALFVEEHWNESVGS